MALRRTSSAATTILSFYTSLCPYHISRTLSTSVRRSDASTSLPRVAKPSFWRSLIPKPFRSPSSPSEAAERAEQQLLQNQQRSGRPRTESEYITFLVLALVVGSNAINMISLRNDSAGFARKSDARIETLRDVIRRLKKGEKVDVKKELGTGDPEQEREWSEVVQELAGRSAIGSAAAKRRKEEEEKELERLREGGEKDVEPDGRQEKSSRPKFIM